MTMEKITRQGVLDLLSGDWADYVGRFQSFSSPAQAAFLEKQGYKRLTDLLAHIVAWWEEGLQAIQRFQSDSTARQPEMDVDSFNARAVEKVPRGQRARGNTFFRRSSRQVHRGGEEAIRG